MHPHDEAQPDPGARRVDHPADAPAVVAQDQPSDPLTDALSPEWSYLAAERTLTELVARIYDLDTRDLARDAIRRIIDLGLHVDALRDEQRQTHRTLRRMEHTCVKTKPFGIDPDCEACAFWNMQRSIDGRIRTTMHTIERMTHD